MWRRHVCYECKLSVCGGDELQPVAHLSHKLQCARQSLKIMVSYGNKYPRHNARPHVVEQSGQCARALRERIGLRSSKIKIPKNALKTCGALVHSVIKFDRRNKWDFCYYGQVISSRLESNVASEL